MGSMEFVDCRRLIPGSRVDVETRNRHYVVECLGGDEIRISGHPQYCPQPVRGRLQGSADQTGLVAPGLIGAGCYMRFVVEDHNPVQTSRVMRVRVLTQ